MNHIHQFKVYCDQMFDRAAAGQVVANGHYRAVDTCAKSRQISQASHDRDAPYGGEIWPTIIDKPHHGVLASSFNCLNHGSAKTSGSDHQQLVHDHSSWASRMPALYRKASQTSGE